MSILSDIRKGESRKIEFKEYLPESSKISKTIISFSNGAGGKLIKEQRKAKGNLY